LVDWNLEAADFPDPLFIGGFLHSLPCLMIPEGINQYSINMPFIFHYYSIIPSHDIPFLSPFYHHFLGHLQPIFSPSSAHQLGKDPLEPPLHVSAT